MGGLPPEAYGRVTAPERYALLHVVAGRLIDELTRGFRVAAEESAEVDPLLASLAKGALRAVLLAPEPPTAAPISICWTDFPGLLVRYGRWHIQPYPTCGCDACDEQPEDLVRKLHEDTMAVVAGHFQESFDGRWLAMSMSSRSAGGLVDGRPDRHHLGAPGTVRWAPWAASR